MYSGEMLLGACLMLLLGGLPSLISMTTTTTFVAAMTIANQDLERHFRQANATHTFASMGEERIAMDVFNYAFLNWSYIDAANDNTLIEVDYKEEKARYGEGRVMSVTGQLVHISQEEDVSDDYACAANIRGTLGTPLPPKGVAWIALVRRGRCTFEEKVKNIYQQHAVGVIVYNEKQVMQLEKMQIKGKNRLIAAVITYQSIGLELASVVDKGHNVTMSILEGRNGVRPISSLNRTSVLFVSIAFIVLMIISLVWLIFYYIQRFRYMQAKDQQSRNLCSVTKKAIMKIPTKTGKMTDEKDVDSDCCAICIEAYKPSDIIRILPCKHEFHKNCIDPWLIEHRTCPMCKLDVLKFYGYVFLGSEESILEYEPERPARVDAAAAIPINATPAVLTNPGNPTRAGALADLIRSRDFVIDFPRVFVLESGSMVGARETLFPARLPERSQSSLSLQQARDWMSQMTNKLEEQQGLGLWRQRKDAMQQQLLSIQDSQRHRRSRSADARYTSGCFGRQRQQSQQQQLEPVQTDMRRNSSTLALQQLTEASYAQSRQRQRETFDFARTRRRFMRRESDEISLYPFQRRVAGVTMPAQPRATPRQDSDDSTTSPDVNITIQVNGRGVELND